METKNYLGIYLKKDAATAVCLCAQADGYNILDSFSVSIEETEEQNYQSLINRIAETCAERKTEFSEVSLALDCAMFMQHNIHSEFDDPKQIAQTIRFDTEDVLAADVADIAIAFKINSTDESGSELTVYTAERELLADIILSLQSNNLDPVIVEPDVHCLWRFIYQNFIPSENSYPLFTMLSKNNAYFITPDFSDSSKQPAMRTFLLGTKQNRTDMLLREVPVTIALIKSKERINRLQVYDSAELLDYNQLEDVSTIQIERVDLLEAAGVETQKIDNCDGHVEFAIAYGAAASLSEKTQAIDFRSDFLPYQGKKLRLQKILKLLSISLTILLFGLGLNIQLQWFQKNKPVINLQRKFEAQYITIMGKEPSKRTNPITALETEVRRIKGEKSGKLSITGEESISAKLTRVLSAFNKCAAQTSLNIDSVSITTRNVTIAGDTSSRRNTLKFVSSLEANNLKNPKYNLEPKGERDNFRITIELKR